MLSSNPLIVLSIELRQGQFAQLKIYRDSDPQKLAQEFVTANELSLNYLQPIKQNIIKQMCLYDSIQNNKDKGTPPVIEKENKSPRRPIFETERVGSSRMSQKQPQHSTRTPEREKSKPKSIAKKIKTQATDTDTDKEVDTYHRLYQQSKDLNIRKQVRQDDWKKKKEDVAMSDPNLTFKPVINEKSKKMVTLKKAPVVNKSPLPSFHKQPKQHTTYPSRSPQQRTPQKKAPPQFNPKSPRLTNLCKKHPEVSVSILENAQSFTQSSNQSIQDFRPQLFSHSPPPIYTEDQIENSFNDFIKKEFAVNHKVIVNLFKILDGNDCGYVDPRSVPYERLSSQMIVKLRRVLREYSQPIPFNKFESIMSKDPSLLQTATEFFGCK